MHDRARVRRAERARDLDRVGDRLVHRQAAHPADAVLERLALDELEDDVGRREAVVAAALLAGVDDASVTTQDGASLAATAIRYDSRNDLALLRVGADIPALPVAPGATRGTAGAVLGYPENGPYTVTPARLGGTREAISEDSYGHGPIRRTISSLRGSVRSGNSGGPLVDSRGRVLGTVFAATTSGSSGGFAVPNEIVRTALAQTGSTPVDTGPCT